jgi:trehalose utilization protein
MMGTTCNLLWRGEREGAAVVSAGAPDAEGCRRIPSCRTRDGGSFDIPAPDTLVFISWFEGGEVFRSGCCYQRGRGRVFYFRPGHETFPSTTTRSAGVITNAVRWAARRNLMKETRPFGQRRWTQCSNEGAERKGGEGRRCTALPGRNLCVPWR